MSDDVTTEREIQMQVAAEELPDDELLEVADSLFNEMFEQEEDFSLYEQGILPF